MAIKNRPIGRIDGQTNFAARDFVVGSGVTVTDGDFVYFASGVVTNATVAGARILGMALGTATGNAAGTVKVSVCIDPNMQYLIDGDQVGTTLGITHVGTNFDLVGATGAQLVDTSTTGGTGSLVLVEFNPKIAPVESDVSFGTYVIAENALFTTTGGQ